ncbi:hypothetical protein D9758_006192 [Tetrapyrgos nigripes]|uniref:FAD-binding PCMH-type domain-containing protein n=1 Tax=Tetrapyrgos nigripes TaxID=182062 RepID=A0A8H5GAL6_9AGAR|nr:hypothetical protein D9758_006192 [Tetrapyrgos nigripes]
MVARISLITAFATLVVGELQRSCRILPTDPSWPNSEVWEAFNQSIDGRLIKTVPIGSPCHDPTYDEAECNLIRENWHIPDFHEPNPSSLMDPTFLNKSCDPFDPRETPCRIGAYVQYAVNVSSPEHVIKTVKFVKEHNIRFVVKNTGHDYLGRSTATGAVSVWLHNLQNITFLPQYTSSGYSGPAFKVHTGVTVYDLEMEAHSRGLAIVGGECPTVAFAGGYLQGGGHSALTSFYGLAADQTLEFEVITTQGKFVRASPTSNEDLYWALSGGGGGYGVVWSATVKAQQDLPATVASLNFTIEGIDQETFWKAIDAYQASTPTLTDTKIFSIAVYTKQTFSLNPVFAVDKSASEVSTLLQPLTNTLDDLGVEYEIAVNTYDGYLDAYNTITFLREFKVGDNIFGSRLLPRLIWEDKDKLKELQDTITQILEDGAIVQDFSLRATGPGNSDNAVLPAWRDAERHFAVILPTIDGDSLEDVARDRNRITNKFMPALKQLTPGSGSYVNEGDPYEPDFKEAFYGSNYDRLLEIKDKWDPRQVLYGSLSVGGDRWKQTEEGRLCRTEDVHAVPYLVDPTSYHNF